MLFLGQCIVGGYRCVGDVYSVGAVLSCYDAGASLSAYDLPIEAPSSCSSITLLDAVPRLVPGLKAVKAPCFVVSLVVVFTGLLLRQV